MEDKHSLENSEAWFSVSLMSAVFASEHTNPQESLTYNVLLMDMYSWAAFYKRHAKPRELPVASGKSKNFLTVSPAGHLYV